MVTNDKTRELLIAIKLICPRMSLPKKNPEATTLINIWSKALTHNREHYPDFIWEQAIAEWASTATSQTPPPLPGDIASQADKIWQSLRSSYKHGKQIQAWEQQCAEERSEWVAKHGPEAPYTPPKLELG